MKSGSEGRTGQSDIDPYEFLGDDEDVCEDDEDGIIEIIHTEGSQSAAKTNEQPDEPQGKKGSGKKKDSRKTENSRLSSNDRNKDYEAAALYLAKSYGNLLKEKEYIRKVLSGEFTYTEDDALEELISTTASTESDTGVRVSTSNISNTTERIGMLLANGFVEKRNREILKEVLKDTEGRRYLLWKLDVVETAKAERMGKIEKWIFEKHYVEGWTYKMIRENYSGKKLYDQYIRRMCCDVEEAIADEIRFREAEVGNLVNRLFSDTENNNG